MKKKKQLFIVLFTFLILIAGIYNYSTKDIIDTLGERTLNYGSKGDDVEELQTKLSNLGLYHGAIDGIYGPLTAEAVRQYQKNQGLGVDGIAGPKTIASLLGTQEAEPAVSGGWAAVNNQDDIRLLSRAVYGEARGEPYIGQVAIAAVILNRVEHPSFPNTISGVIFQPGAFTAVNDGQFWLNPDASAQKAAIDALNGWDPTNGSLYYWNPATATSSWIWSRTILLSIGKHVFGK